MKYRILCLNVLLLCVAHSQNRASFSQYMINQGIFNPGYFDSEKDLSGTLYYRNQWIGVDGAPNNYAFTGAYNLGNHGIHLNALNDKITVIDNTQFGVGYNYVARISREKSLSFGVNVSLGKFSARYNELNVNSSTDVVFQNSTNANFLNFGTGLYYQGEYLYFGLSAPNLFNNQLKNSGTLMENGFNKNHLYGFIGAKFGYEKLVFAPSSMVKFVMGAPLQLDLDLNFIFNERFWFGIGGRTDKTIKTSLGILFNKGFQIIYTYDAGFFAMYNNHFGSHELTLSYGNSFYSSKFPKRKYLTKKAYWKRKLNKY